MTPDVPKADLSGDKLEPDVSVEPELDLSTDPELLVPEVSGLELLPELLDELSVLELPPESPDAATAPIRGVRSRSPIKIITAYFFIIFPPFICDFPDIAGVIK